jgi:FAD:protein FMN transferase
MLRATFPAMGTTVELLLDAPEGRTTRAAMGAARREVGRLERLLSRFRPDSEVSVLNRDRSLRAGPDLLRVLDAALALRRRTGGLFDPTVGRAVRDWGYDRPFHELPVPDRRPVPSGGPAGGTVAIDRATGWVGLGPGVRIDLGAIAKGDAADRACALLGAAGPCLVNAGGDLRVSGPAADGRPWPVALAGAPGAPVLRVAAGGLATSGVDRRRWTRAGRPAHHVIAPSSGAPAPTDLVRATVGAPSCAEADALATALLVAGAAAARRLADAWGVPAALACADGSLTCAGGLR